MNRNTQTTHCYIRFVRLCSNCRGVLCTPLSYGLVLQQSNQPRKIKMDTDDRIIFVLFVIRLYDWLASLVNYLSTSTTNILRHQIQLYSSRFYEWSLLFIQFNEAARRSNNNQKTHSQNSDAIHSQKNIRSFSHSRETSFDIFQFE